MRIGLKLTAKIILCVVFLSCILWSCLSLNDTVHTDVTDARKFISTSLYDFCEKIDVSGLNIKKEELTRLWTEIVKNDPYLFFVNTSVGYAASDGKILALYPTYNMTQDEYAEKRRFCERKISQALAFVRELTDEREIAMYLHDYICFNFWYDESLENNNMYLFLSSGRGTCQGYTYTYMAMLRAVGIECTFAASDSMEHIWNLVKINGEWYHVDVTWDDYPDVFASCKYDNFLKSDKAIKASHRDWYSTQSTACTFEKYDSEQFESPFAQFTGTGDANCDGVVDVMDIVLCEIESEKLPTNAHFFKTAADFDGNFAITTSDIAVIRKKILG